jgi:hypothetical protein
MFVHFLLLDESATLSKIDAEAPLSEFSVLRYQAGLSLPEAAERTGYPGRLRHPGFGHAGVQAVWQFGNSVAVPAFCEVARIMLPHIRAP